MPTATAGDTGKEEEERVRVSGISHSIADDIASSLSTHTRIPAHHSHGYPHPYQYPELYPYGIHSFNSLFGDGEQLREGRREPLQLPARGAQCGDWSAGGTSRWRRDFRRPGNRAAGTSRRADGCCIFELGDSVGCGA